MVALLLVQNFALAPLVAGVPNLALLAEERLVHLHRHLVRPLVALLQLFTLTLFRNLP